LEERYNLVVHCKVGTYETAMSMPVAIRKWWIKRFQKQNEPKESRPPPAGPPPKGRIPGAK
jgi:hypothetical protein